MLATNVVAPKYFRGTPGTPERERSVRQLVGRVVDTITALGPARAATSPPTTDRATFHAELTHLLLRQKMAFNSPVWFNVGVEEHPQCSACFINSVDDSMESILGLAKTEGMLFKYGSRHRHQPLAHPLARKELLAGGGTASGPVSFMKGFDAFAGVIKSGGKTRRAAKMVILNADHPDILDFIRCKASEEKKAWALIDAGYDGVVQRRGVRVDLLPELEQLGARHRRVHEGGRRGPARGTTRAVRDGRPMDTYRARDLFREIAEAAWLCGDPGLQFDTTINDWHTCPNTARINASQPVLRVHVPRRLGLQPGVAEPDALPHASTASFDVEAFQHAVDVTLLAQEIIVDIAQVPDRADRGELATPTGRSASATPTWARC